MIPDELARIAEPEMAELWSPLISVRDERELWLVVMRKQRELGVNIPSTAIEASEAAVGWVSQATLLRIDERERKTRHDLKARLEVFCEDAGHEYHHLGMTSADVVDNMAQVRMLRSMRWLAENRRVLLPALGRYSMRGIKGAVGTHQDQLDLLGSHAACVELDEHVAQHFGFASTMTATGQVYPRSQDLEVLSELTVAVATHGGNREQLALMSGFQTMAAAYSGDQWNEGDVSTSVVRRYCLRGAWFVASAAIPPPPTVTV